jgi:hypothetical protein
MPSERTSLPITGQALAKTGMAALQCATATSRHSLLEFVGGSYRTRSGPSNWLDHSWGARACGKRFNQRAPGCFTGIAPVHRLGQGEFHRPEVRNLRPYVGKVGRGKSAHFGTGALASGGQVQ